MRILKYNDQRDTNHLYIKEEQAVSVCPKHKLAPTKNQNPAILSVSEYAPYNSENATPCHKLPTQCQPIV